MTPRAHAPATRRPTEPNAGSGRPVAVTWLTTASDSSIGSLLALRPDLAARFVTFRNLIDEEHLVDPVVLELCRLRIAAMLGDSGAASAPTAGVDVPAGLIESLASWPTADQFSALQRAALTVAELFVIDAHAVTDEQIAELERHIGADGVVALCTALGLFDGESRMRLTLGDR